MGVDLENPLLNVCQCVARLHSQAILAGYFRSHTETQSASIKVSRQFTMRKTNDTNIFPSVTKIKQIHQDRSGVPVIHLPFANNLMSSVKLIIKDPLRTY